MKRQLPRRAPPLTVSRAFGQKSPLADADIQAFLARCLSADQWQSYSDEERARILGCIPQSRKHSQTTTRCVTSLNNASEQSSHPKSSPLGEVPLPQNSTSSDGVSYHFPISSDVGTDTYIKRAVARFQRDLGDGYYEKSWQDKARRAHQERMDGKFDEYVKQHAEEVFEDAPSADENNGEEQDELAQFSEDGEYLDTSTRRGRGRGRPTQDG